MPNRAGFARSPRRRGGSFCDRRGVTHSLLRLVSRHVQLRVFRQPVCRRASDRAGHDSRRYSYARISRSTNACPHPSDTPWEELRPAGRRFPARARWEHAGRAALIVGGLGALPDLDLLFNDHRGPSHSVGAAIIVGLVALAVTRSVRWSVAATLAWGSHTLLDWLGNDTFPPIGIMALWPFSHGYYQSSLHLFPAVSRSYWLADFWMLQHQSGGRGALPGRSRGRSGHGRDEVSSRAVVTLPRFLASDLDPIAGSASLSADEAHHLIHVLRLRFGDEISVFDGGGREYRARIERVTRDGAHLLLLEEISAAPEPAVRLTLAQAVLKGDHMDDVVRDATMMGASAIEPLLTERTIVRARGLADGNAADRWRRVAIASAKQCRRAVLADHRRRHGAARMDSSGRRRAEAAARRAVCVHRGTHHRQPASDLPATATLLVGPGRWVESAGDCRSDRSRLRPDHARPPDAPSRRRHRRRDRRPATPVGRPLAGF